MILIELNKSMIINNNYNSNNCNKFKQKEDKQAFYVIQKSKSKKFRLAIWNHRNNYFKERKVQEI